jgi:pimeloyl-ACP methyl ester carboxylesterase
MTRSLALSQTRYEFRAGEARRLAGDRETLDFVSKAKRLWIGIDGVEAKGFVVGPALRGDEPLLAASYIVQPGEYTLTISATSGTGEERVTTLSVVLNPMQPVPPTATKPPVVLLNGWQFGFSNGGCPISSGPSDTFGNLAQYLKGDSVPVVYLFDNCVECPNCKIEDLGNTLQQFLNLIQYSTGGLVPQIDLVTHSMGGLIARTYLAGLQADGSLLPPPNPRIRKLVLIAEPNFGSFIAVNIGTQAAEMIPGSSLLWELATWNQGGDDLRGVDAVAIIGNAGSWNSMMNASDGVVSLTSGSIGFARDASRTRILTYCHIDPGPLVDLFMDCSTAPGIAQIDSVMHPTWTIIQSFLAGTPDWASIGGTPSADPYLSQYGGVYFALENSADQFLADLTQVLFGAVALQNGGAAGTVFYNEFTAGTGTFDATSSSLGQVTHGPTTVPPGRFTAVRAKFAPVMSSVGPVLPNSSAALVQSGTTITIRGAGFGQLSAICQVLASPAGSSVGYPLQILTWNDKTITAVLPAKYTGLVKLFLKTASGQDEINIMAGPSLAGSMAHLASGGGWDTTLTLINTSASPGEALLDFFGNDGSALQLPVAFPKTPSFSALITSTLDRPLGANSLLVLDSQQPANPNSQVGSAQLFGNVSGFAIFKYTLTGQEAVVPLETRNAPFYVLGYDNTGGLATGVAIANVASQPANIPVVIRDDTGAQIGTNTISLAAQGHTSFMLTGSYPVTAGKRGTIEFDTPPSGRISALGLRASDKALTTIPLLANETPGGGSMAQVASGGGWQTTFTLVNTGKSSAQAQLSFFDNNGNALPLPLTFVQTGNVTTVSTLTQTVAAGATLLILTHGSDTGAPLVGSAQLTTTGTVSGFAIFRYNVTGQEAVVPLETRNASAYVLAFDNTGDLATGVALANVSNQPANVPIVLHDDTGASLGTATVSLAPKGHTSFMLTGSYASVAGKRGTVEFDSPGGAQISVLGLRATPAGAVTTIPVLAK